MVWGRGTLDDKGSVVGICSAVEELLAEGFVPSRDVWLSFGSTEEVSGTTAVDAVAELRARGVAPWFVLDEGGAVASGAFPMVTAPLAVVGVTEKGVTSVELVAEGAGGHASTPAANGPTARLARAITALERSPLPARAPAPTLELLRRLGPQLPAPLRPVMARADRLAPVLTRVLRAAGAEAAAMVRTTAAVTTLSGSPALNVIASSARAGVNLRVMVGDTVDGVLAHVRRTVGDGVRVEVVERNEPSPVSPWDDDAFRLLERITGEVFPEAVPTPYVMMAATDARFFTAICARVYRFTPFRMTKAAGHPPRRRRADRRAGPGGRRPLVPPAAAGAAGMTRATRARRCSPSSARCRWSRWPAACCRASTPRSSPTSPARWASPTAT